MYGCFPCNAEGNDLGVYEDPAGRAKCGRFTFPRQHKGRHLCLADFHRPRAPGHIGVVPGDEDPRWPQEGTRAIVAHHPQAKYFIM